MLHDVGNVLVLCPRFYRNGHYNGSMHFIYHSSSLNVIILWCYYCSSSLHVITVLLLFIQSSCDYGATTVQLVFM